MIQRGWLRHWARPATASPFTLLLVSVERRWLYANEVGTPQTASLAYANVAPCRNRIGQHESCFVSSYAADSVQESWISYASRIWGDVVRQQSMCMQLHVRALAGIRYTGLFLARFQEIARRANIEKGCDIHNIILSQRTCPRLNALNKTWYACTIEYTVWHCSVFGVDFALLLCGIVDYE